MLFNSISCTALICSTGNGHICFALKNLESALIKHHHLTFRASFQVVFFPVDFPIRVKHQLNVPASLKGRYVNLCVCKCVCAFCVCVCVFVFVLLWQFFFCTENSWYLISPLSWVFGCITLVLSSRNTLKKLLREPCFCINSVLSEAHWPFSLDLSWATGSNAPVPWGVRFTDYQQLPPRCPLPFSMNFNPLWLNVECSQSWGYFLAKLFEIFHFDLIPQFRML